MDGKGRKQPDRLLFHNWVIQRIPPSSSEIVFRPIPQTCKFSLHSKEMKVECDSLKVRDEARQVGYLWVSYTLMPETAEC